MLFNSFIFIYFFIVVYFLYVITNKSLKLQNSILLIASYIFYGYWDSRFLLLIFISTVIDFFVGHKLFNTRDDKARKKLLAISVVANLGILGFFKYFNFFADSLITLFNIVGFEADPITLNIILPVGISFYTFQTMSYTIDIYRKKLNPCKSFMDFALFVSFFPQLVAGPIERAVHLVPQIEKRRKITLNEINAGIFLILWGFFKKVVVADNVAQISDKIFNNYQSYEGADLLIGLLAFTVQIYGDFSGYSDIARGISKMMGFDLLVNFKLPYFALNPSDFWNRWHISLSSWLRDYLYISLGGNKKGKIRTYLNLFITMVLGGLWHGAAWNYVLWGVFHGGILIGYRKFDKGNEHKNPWRGEHSNIKTFLKMGLMFIFTLIGWLLFRARSMEQIGYFFANIWKGYSSSTPDLFLLLSFFSLPLVIIQFWQYIKEDLMIITKQNFVISSLIYAFFLTWIMVFGYRESTEFIYFQF